VLYPLSYEGGSHEHTRGTPWPWRLLRCPGGSRDPAGRGRRPGDRQVAADQLRDRGLRLARRARKERPDAIILDAMMPGINRVDGAKPLRARKDTREIPIILLSATARAPDVAAGRNIADRSITKPFDPLELLDLVAGILRDRPAHRLANSD
jgi:DNA-binding response OmpR family regulator